MLFHEDKLRLFLTFNNSITMLEMRVKIRDRVFSHEKPVVGVVFNTVFNQVSRRHTLESVSEQTGQPINYKNFLYGKIRTNWFKLS